MSNKHSIIRLRRGTESEWANSEPQPGGEVLKLGEPGYETDTGRLKIGDGYNSWNNLNYIAGGASVNEEELQDLIGNNFLIAGSGIGVSYNDNLNTITISNSGVSVVSNFGDNKLLTSSGTSTGINAESNVTYDQSYLQVLATDSSGNAGIKVLADNKPASIYIQSHSNDQSTNIPRLVFRKTKGTLDTPTVSESNDTIFSITGDTINQSGNYQSLSRMRSQVVVAGSGSSSSSTAIKLETSSGGSNTLDNSVILYNNGQLNHNGYMTIEDGLSAPTPIYNLGASSGNTAISYSVDKQIQTLTLNGASINFTEGTGWDITDRSVDVLLNITVNSTTTVAFDSGFVTDWYNTLPVFTSGTYLTLLRSVGSGVVQGHYIGKKI